MRPRRALATLLCTVALSAAPVAAVAQPKPGPALSVTPADTAPPAQDAAPDSPRASVQRYFELCRAGEYAEAAGYLDVPEASRPLGAQLARRLKTVLDRQIWIKLEDISPRPLGKQVGQLPGGFEEIGAIPGPTGPVPVRLVRRRFPEGDRWIFSRTTVEHIDGWYDRLRDRWQDRYLPELLLRTGPEELMWWQWIALPILFALALGAGNVLAWGTRVGLRRVVARTKTPYDDALLARLSGPLTLAWALLAVYLALPRLALFPPAHAFLERVLKAGAFIAIFWFGTRSIDVAAAGLDRLPATHTLPGARSLVPMGARALKIAVVFFAGIAVLSELGYPVASLLTGLGIGGVALALAAQKTVENLFGSLSIGIDQPFRIGDFIAVDGISGTVESIGLRSTRLRTLDRTLVTMPNGKLADMRIESFAPRDRIKFTCTLSLDRGTPAAKVREVLAGVRGFLKEHPKAWRDFSVSLSKIADASLDVEVLAWFQTTEWSEFLRLREAALLSLLEIVERAGVRLAGPVQVDPPKAVGPG